MPKPKHFISISTETLNNKLVLINTSCGESLFNENGIDFKIAIEFLFSLVKYRKDETTTVFTCYNFSRDNEYIFSTMPRHLKDKLFLSEPIAKKISELELENEHFFDTLYTKDEKTKEFQKAEFGRAVNEMVLRDLVEVKFNGYEVKLANGKSLTIRAKGSVITFYDIANFFGNPVKPLRRIVLLWLLKDLILLDRPELEKIQCLEKHEKLKLHSLLTATATAKLATKLNVELEKQGLYLIRFHGATALSSLWLGTRHLDAKAQYHNYRYQRQCSPELWKAVRQANYGGRSEQFKLGTLKDVYVYDINSAYAYACSFLPRMLRKPYFVKEWNASPFSVWFCDYDFNSVNHRIGLLPNREVGSNSTKWKLGRGRGYFWQPEIKFVLENYPECVQINGGFVLDYEQAEFAKGIETLYQLRLALQRQGNPLEKVFKLALAAIYGKFCQHNGRSHYYNLFYAGFVTSFTRMQLLEAVKGYENETISFQTDAIHTLTNSLSVDIGNAIGATKRIAYDNVTYLDNGVYRANNFNVQDINKTRGFSSFEFEKALTQIRDKQTYNAVVKFFITHNLFTKNMFTGAPYLSSYEVDKQMNPLSRERSAMRLFEVTGADLATDYFNSKPLRSFSGLESGVYRKNNFRQIEGAIL